MDIRNEFASFSRSSWRLKTLKHGCSLLVVRSERDFSMFAKNVQTGHNGYCNCDHYSSSHYRGKTSDLWAVFGTSATVQAEVFWCLNTAMQHNSYISNEGISELFVAMFPDWQITESFTCGKDKTSYIIEFGLALYFKNKSTSAVNNAGWFVLMFDENFNQSTKSKQLDVHVRFWEAGCVQSRYLGSQFKDWGSAAPFQSK